LKHLLERVAARVLEIDQDDVRIDRRHARQELIRFTDMVDIELVAAVLEPFLEDCRPDEILVDDQDFERPGRHSKAAGCKDRAKRGNRRATSGRPQPNCR
jgi:hypothetical protein